MAEVSPWFAQALQYIDPDGSARVFKFETREEVIQFVSAETLFREQGLSTSSLPDERYTSGSLYDFVYGRLFERVKYEGVLAIGIKHQEKPWPPPKSIRQGLKDLGQWWKYGNTKDTKNMETDDPRGYFQPDSRISPADHNPNTNRDPHEGMRRYKFALVFRVSTQFNPSGIWVIEDSYNDAEELEY